MIKKVRTYLQEKPLDSRVFLIVLFVGMLTALFSMIFTATEGFGYGAVISVGICLLSMVLIWVIAFVFKKEAICHILLCLVLNLVLLPVTFYFCGGLRSGMTLYFLTALYIVIPTLSKRWVRAVIYVTSMLVMVCCIQLSRTVLSQYVVQVSESVWYQDVVVSFILNAFCLFYISSLTVCSYEGERARNEELVRKLEELSLHDELTGLYNRRELFRMMETDVMTAKKDNLYCLFMLDVDEFKRTNDTFGHVFGDKVLREVARCLQNATGTLSEGEIAARYGGEEFVCIFHDKDFDTSYDRAEKIRQEIEKLRFQDNPDFRVTISGGVDRCNGMRPRYALRQVDDLLYVAKTAGKNLVTRKG